MGGLCTYGVAITRVLSVRLILLMFHEPNSCLQKAEVGLADEVGTSMVFCNV